jgi:hypothetical protein
MCGDVIHVTRDASSLPDDTIHFEKEKSYLTALRNLIGCSNSHDSASLNKLKLSN